MRIDRRRFLEIVAGGAAVGVVGCVGNPDPDGDPDDDDDDDDVPGPDAAASGADAAGEPTADAALPGCDAGTVMMYDTNAQALYMDGTYGPLTGVIYVDYILANEELTLDFWHGHGGQIHKFMLKPEHFAALKRGERVTITTSEVDSHMHTLFIDPTDPFYRVAGADPVAVSLGCE